MHAASLLKLLVVLSTVTTYPKAIRMEVQGEVTSGISQVIYTLEGWIESANILRVRVQVDATFTSGFTSNGDSFSGLVCTAY